MVYLFIHQSFPGQYLHVVRYLVSQGHRVHFIAQSVDAAVDGVELHLYAPDRVAQPNCHALTIELDNSIRNGVGVADICRRLRDEQALIPDILIGHSGWGETLFIKDIFPDVVMLTYFEFYYHAAGVDVGFDPEFTSVFGEPDMLRTRNAVNLMAYDATDWAQSPTQWQRSLMPPELRSRITVLHEGIDTDRVCPLSGATFRLPNSGLELRQGDAVITYISRNLEAYRGFHSFARAMPEILRRHPDACIVIVGEDGAGYGSQPPPGSNFREVIMGELSAQLDLSRIHFIPKLEYDLYIQLLQVSAVHVYLTYPFVLSWSFLEAMAAGCLVIGSATPPVLEFLEDEVNGLAVDFFSPEEIARGVERVLAHPDLMQALRHEARRFIVENFDLQRVQLPRWQALFDDLMQGRRPLLDP